MDSTMLLPYALAFLAGIIVKIVDWLDDEKRSNSPSRYALAISYGIILGYLIGNAPFSALFLATLIAQVFARKLDTTAHRLGFFICALSLLAFGLPAIDLWFFALFLMAAFLDEADFIGPMRPLTRWRPFLKITALLPVLYGRWDYFLGIIAFDFGYELFNALPKDGKFRNSNTIKKRR